MVNRTYALRHQDQMKLISYACRYRSIRTTIDEVNGVMNVYTTFADNGEPTSIADQFKLEVVAEGIPAMPPDEYRRRVEGNPF